MLGQQGKEMQNSVTASNM